MSHAELNKHLKFNLYILFLCAAVCFLKLKKSLSACFIVFLILVVDISEPQTLPPSSTMQKLSYTYNGYGTHGNWFLHYSVRQRLNRLRSIMLALHASLGVTPDAATLIDAPIARISSWCYVTRIALLLNFLYSSLSHLFIQIDIYILETSCKETQHLVAVNLHQSPIREY
jgi:hypothetical protein